MVEHCLDNIRGGIAAQHVLVDIRLESAEWTIEGRWPGVEHRSNLSFGVQYLFARGHG